MQIRRFASIEEIRSIQGYTAEIHKLETQEPRFLGYYRLKERVQCALANCHHWHGYGYVAQTADDQVVAIGNVCGAQLFGDLWQAAASAFDRKIRRMQLRESLDARLTGLPELLQRLDELLYAPYGAVWLEKAERSLARVCPEQVLR